MANPEQHQLVVPMGAGAQFSHDLRHVYSAVRLTEGSGQQVEVAELWTPEPVIVELPGGDPAISQVLTPAKALEVADRELDRFDTVEDDDDLLKWEAAIRRALRGDRQLTLEVQRTGLADILCRMGGLAIFGGTQQGVRSAADNYEDLRLIGRSRISSA